MSHEKPLNILLLVWDAARFDYVRKHAPFLNELRENNLWFESAYAPSTWSLPSHPSIFNGQLPSEHSCYRVADQLMDELPLVETLGEQGYETYGVSGNGFANQRNGFDIPFDEFVYTADWGPSSKGLNVTEYAYELRGQRDTITSKEIAKATFSKSLSHEYPFRSILNFGTVLLNRVATRSNRLQRIPHPLFDSNTQYSYDSERNTDEIKSFISGSDGPFFIFANYMDTHRPYYPSAEFREEHTKSLSYSDATRLNQIAAPWEFIKRINRSENLDTEVEQIQSLYAGEVAAVDNQLRKLVEFLEANGYFESTIIVVTSDHGENLGETDLLGNRRMGHEASISEQLLRVPLLVAHPNLEPRSVSEPVSNRRIFDFLTGVFDSEPTDVQAATDAFITDGPVCVEYPATGGSEIYERYPDVSREALGLRTSVHHSVAVEENWLTIADSTGQRFAFENRTEQDFKNAPAPLQHSCEANLSRLCESESDDSELSQEEISQLEALGYM